jgi:hypothetical protein
MSLADGISPQYQQNPQLQTIARRLIRKYPEHFGHLDADRMLFLMEITGSDNKNIADCRRVTQPWRDLLYSLGVDADWMITFYSVHCEGKGKAFLAAVMFHEMLHCGEDGKVVKHDVQDFHLVLHHLGLNWQRDAELPDITRRKITNVRRSI